MKTEGKYKVSESGNPAFNLCIVEDDGRSICHITNWPEQEAHAELIYEALNVSNETGLSPRELADQNKELSKRLISTNDYLKLMAKNNLIPEGTRSTIKEFIYWNEKAIIKHQS